MGLLQVILKEISEKDSDIFTHTQSDEIQS